jgi:D-glycero-D-manno-heptose 1,7-bisphosphate phosphatase
MNIKPPQGTYVHTWKEFIFLPKVIEALRLLKKKGYTMYIVTNQPGIARGVVTKKQVDTIHSRLLRELQAKGIKIGAVYMCPHGWNEECPCRKPNPGLFFDAASQHGINLTESICIGDDVRDIIAGKRAACKTVFIGERSVDTFSPNEQPDTIYKTLYDAARHI